MFKAFLIPVGQNRYQPYCEPPDREPVGSTDAPRGLLRRLRDRFKEMLAEAEIERRRAARGETRPPAPTRVGRLRDRLLCYVAEHVAEKRLLWHLRHEQTAVLLHPDDISGDEALSLLRAEMRRDTDRHLLWLVVNTVLFIASGALALVPGPNVIAYFLGFFVVSHYLSWRGARHGLGAVAWQAEPSAPLAELRAALRLDAPVRDSSIRDIAARLSLEDLPTFVQRVALRVVPNRA
jgi:hypothetical protein